LNKAKRNAIANTAGKLSPAGAKIVAAFEQAIEALRSGEPVEWHFTVIRHHGQSTRIMTTVTIEERVALRSAAGAEGTEDEDEP